MKDDTAQVRADEIKARVEAEIEVLARELCDTYYLTVDPERKMSDAYDKITERTRVHWRAQARLLRMRGWKREPTPVEDILAEVQKHHVRIGVMASPGHWSYELAHSAEDAPKSYASCHSDSRGGEVGCGWDSEPNNYPDRDEAWAAAHAHVAESIKTVLP